MNPLEEFLASEKTAAMLPPGFGTNIRDIAMMGAVGAGTTAAISGVIPAAQALYGAATKGRDFKQMLAFDPELKELHKQNPKYITAGFNTLRRMNPEFSADPMVSSAFVKQVAFGQTEGAFGLAQEALRSAPKPSAMQDAFVSGAGAGMSAGIQDFMRQRQESRDMSPQDKAEMEHGYKMQQGADAAERRDRGGMKMEIFKSRMQRRAQGQRTRDAVRMKREERLGEGDWKGR